MDNTYLSTKLSAFYSSCGDMDAAQVIFDGIVNRSSFLWNFMIRGYASCGFPVKARKVFDRMPLRDLTSWNSMISGYVKNGMAGKALDTFRSMREGGISGDATTLLGVLSSCAELLMLKQGKEVHGYVVRNGYGIYSTYLGNSMVEVYCKCSFMDYAGRLFETMARKKDTVSWNSLIAGYARKEDAFESLRTFYRMVSEGFEPDQVTYVTVLGVCEQITALQFGMSIHASLIKEGFGLTTMVGTSLIDMYAKCGSLACSRHVFDEMNHYKNLVSWSAMISGYSIHGRAQEAIELFNQMTDETSIQPDEGVLTSVLSACSHGGLVKEGREIFNRMPKDYNITPQLAHYSCFIDLLSRSGCLKEAHEVIQAMKIDPSSDIWAALLNGCRLHNNLELAEISAEKVLSLNPNNVSSYVSLSNVYASEKRWDDVERIRSLVRSKGLTKPPGCSFVEIDKRVHRFLVGDKSHEQTEEIHGKLSELRKLVKEAGYKADTSSVLYNVDEGAKEEMLWDHSERLAIAFALLNTGPGTVVRITKNLRVCRDCHVVTKLISKVTGREIVMRDIRRFHHFKDGLCSCGDYW
ncbi:Pentatricopeptide repeat-containing protein At1g08070, chloroplastic [Linum perenne]